MASHKAVNKLKKFNKTTEVKALAREQVGVVKPTNINTPKKNRKPKHKKQDEEE